MAADGLTAEELARAREKSVGQQEIRNQSNQAFAFQAALNELYGLGYDFHLEQRRQIAALTVEEVRAVARKYFSQPAITAIVRPASVNCPPRKIFSSHPGKAARKLFLWLKSNLKPKRAK